MRTTFTTAFHTFLTPKGQLSRLAALPVDGWLCVIDFLEPHDLAALCRTSRSFCAAATRLLYTTIHLESYGALYALVNTLEAAPALGTYILSFSESPSHPFLFHEPPPHLLTRALACMPNLRVLSLRSPIDIATPEFSQALRGLTALEELRLGDATPETLSAVIPFVRPLRALTLRRSSPGCAPRWEAASLPVQLLADYFLSAQHTMVQLEIDGSLLAAVLDALPTGGARCERLSTLRVHGAFGPDSSFSAAFPNVIGAAAGCAADQCDWCAPRSGSAAWDAIPSPDKPDSSKYPWDAMGFALLGAVAGWFLLRL